MVNFLKIVLAIEVMYYANIFCIKVSILFTYLRFVTSSFNILTDIWILLLPISTLREIHRPPREKIALFLIFGVGAVGAVASIVRLHTVYTYTLAKDPFHEGIKVNLWSVIEVTIAISCASVSALKPIFSRRQRRLTLGAMPVGGGGGGGYGYRAYGTGTGTESGSRSIGRWFTKESKGSTNGGLETQSSEDGLHGEGEEAELHTLGSHTESHTDHDHVVEKEKEEEFTRAHKEYRHSVHSSHSRLGGRRDSQQQHRGQQQQHHARQHSRQQSTSLSSPNAPTTDDSTSDTSSFAVSPHPETQTRSHRD
ncbi:hypothetical protein N0V85_008422 [Neurospora sp. IMI 360204]|nr:hypothetical protein N0V85_008422 [Neurospora sp. IMI 360204]